jgi:hypothetical protein
VARPLGGATGCRVGAVETRPAAAGVSRRRARLTLDTPPDWNRYDRLPSRAGSLPSRAFDR